MIIPTILEKDFEIITNHIKILEPVSPIIQIDFADGILVDGKTFLETAKLDTIKTTSKFEIDLMVENTAEFMSTKLNNVSRACCMIGANDLDDFISISNSFGYETGLSISPDTPNMFLYSFLDNYPNEIQYVQFLGVRPGGQGREFEMKVLEKIKDFKHKYPRIKTQVDGHMNKDTILMLKNFHIDNFVVGSAIVRSGDMVSAKTALDKLIS